MKMLHINYLILAHTDPSQLLRLVRALDQDDARFYVHVDAKTCLEQFTRLNFPSNAVFMDKRTSIYWGGVSMVRATLDLMCAAMHGSPDASHLVLLSGLDYPIKPSAVIREFLNANQGSELINYTMMDEVSIARRIRNFSLMEPIFAPASPRPLGFADKCLRRLSYLLGVKRHGRPPFVPCIGSQWWGLTPRCADHLLEYIEQNPWMLDYYKYSFAPDEHFFHTIIANSPLAPTLPNWQSSTEDAPWTMANLHAIQPGLQKVFGESDFEQVKSSDKFFIRKVISGQSDKLVELINTHCLHFRSTG